MAEYSFFAFISYSHADIAMAKKLQYLLEQYTLPTSIHKQRPELPKQFKIFRDTDELTSGILSEELQKNLRQSKYLIVICSQKSAKSKYVGEEIAYFRSLGRERNIIPFIIDGIPNDLDNECFHKELKKDGLNLLGIDIQAEPGRFKSLRFNKAFVRLVAKMLDLNFDILWKRRKRRYIKFWIFILIIFISVTSTIAYCINRVSKESPFDISVELTESVSNLDLPLHSAHEDSIYIYVPNNLISKQLNSTHNKILFTNIPGRYKGEKVRVKSLIYGFHPLDTIVRLEESIKLQINRNPTIYGRICYQILNEDGMHIPDAIVDFGFTQSRTNADGILDIIIPFKYQHQAPYPVTISYLKGSTKTIHNEKLSPFENRTKIPQIRIP